MIIKKIVFQYIEEASFLWQQRNEAVNAPHYSLSDLTKLDKRLEAHIDGLRIAGEQGWQICKEALSWEEPGEVFTAAVLAFESGEESKINEILETGSSTPELARGIISALGWIPYEQAKKHIQRLISAESPIFRRIGIAASAIHRNDIDLKLLEAIKDGDPLLKARALKAVGELGRNDLAPFLQYNLNAGDEKCQFYAAWSAALLKRNDITPVLQSIALKNGIFSESATSIALRQMHLSAAQNWIKELAQSPEHIRKALIGAGVVGDPALIPWLITFMDNNELARVAGEAFTMITGIDIAYEDLEGEWPEGFETGPSENPEDEDVAMDPDEDLPWPDPELIQKWWNSHRNSFQCGKRCLLGKPISPEWCQQVLSIGKQRQRAAAALEIAMSHPQQSLFEVRAPGFRQQRLLR